MSLDVYLYSDTPFNKKGTGIFVRENGSMKELTIDEAKKYYPGSEIKEMEYESIELYSANITHNLAPMANLANVYTCIWKPHILGITTAEHLIDPLSEGLERLKSYPEKYKAFNPANGWGNYEDLVSFVSNYLNACRKNPEAVIYVSR
jgi:hypothetical protein